MGRVVAGEAPSLVVPDTAGGRDAPVARPDDEAVPLARRRPVHRLRDLDRTERRWALALTAAVALAPIAALIHFLPEWTATGDPALMGLRSLDVGTSRTPLLGQPSTAAAYAGAEGHAHHPGALHFYLMAVPIRVLGSAVAMPLVSVAITGSCLLVSLWAVFRQLGKSAAVVAAALLTITAFTTGAASLVNPVSSSIAGYPLLATAVLLWCVLCGDLRLLPLATGVLSFAAQQHLSVDPALAVMTGGVVAVVTWRWARGRRQPTGRPADAADLRRWAGWSALVALVMWSPVLLQQAFGNVGNLGQVVDFARHGNSETVGYGRATWQVAHAFGLPPLLGRTALTGSWLTARPSVTTWLSAAGILATVAAVSWHRRRDDPRVAALGGMVGLICLAGIVSGSSVPAGIEQHRLVFYHWAIAGAFLASLTLGLAALRVVRPLVSERVPRATGVRVALGALAVVAIALPGIVSIRLDRRTNTLDLAYSVLTRAEVDEVVDSVLAHRDELGDHVVLLSDGEPLFMGVKEGVALALVEGGFDVHFPLSSRYFVHDQRLVERDEVDGSVVLVLDHATPTPSPEGGELVLDLELDPGLGVDPEAWEQLVGQVEASTPPTRADLGATLADLPPDQVVLWTEIVRMLWDDPRNALENPATLGFLVDRPEAAPSLDPTLVARVRDTLPSDDELTRTGDMTRLRVYLLDRDETLREGGRSQLGRP